MPLCTAWLPSLGCSLCCVLPAELRGPGLAALRAELPCLFPGPSSLPCHNPGQFPRSQPLALHLTLEQTDTQGPCLLQPLRLILIQTLIPGPSSLFGGRNLFLFKFLYFHSMSYRFTSQSYADELCELRSNDRKRAECGGSQAKNQASQLVPWEMQGPVSLDGDGAS